ncbi:MAG: AAA family ATPase [Reyranellaceae bacterium]
MQTTKVGHQAADFNPNDEETFDAPSGTAGSNVIHLPTTAPENVTCDMFLRTFTRGVSGKNAVAMADAGRGMTRYEWRDGMQQPASPYFCISTVARPPVLGVDLDPEDEDGNPVPPPKLTTSLLDCRETFVIGLDDIGTKVPAGNIPVAPTCRLETSPGNFQCFYLLEAPADPTDAAALIEALRLATNPDGSQKYSDKNGIAGVNRVLRVPGSVNTKPRNNGWRAIVREWEPSRAFTLEGLATAFGVTPMPVSVPQHVQGADTDIVLESLDKLGMVLAPLNSRGFCEITCPWAHEHVSDPRTEAGYKPSKDRGVFHCHHSSCHGRGFSDLCDYLEQNDTDFAGKMLAKLTAEKAERNKCVRDGFAKSPLPEDETDDADVGLAPQVTRRYSLGRDNPVQPRPSRPAVNALLVRKEASVLVAPGGGGKGALLVAMVMALQAQRPDTFDPLTVEKFGGPIHIVSNEDSDDDIVKRRDGWLKHHGLTAGAFVGPQVHIVAGPGFIAFHQDADGGMRVTDAMHKVMRDAQQEGACAVVLDTLSSVIGGVKVNENDNTQMSNVGKRMTELAKRYNVCLLALAHTPKGVDGDKLDGNADALRGGGALKDAVRNVRTLSKYDGAVNDPADKGRVYRLTGAKENHGSLRTLYFKMMIVDVETEDDDGTMRKQGVPVMVPYKLALGYQAESDNAKVAVLTAVGNAERPTDDAPEGTPLRVTGQGGALLAADTIAKQANATAPEVDKTLEALERDGLLHKVPGVKQRNGKAPKVYRLTNKGRDWLAAKQASVLTAVDDDGQELVPSVDPSPADESTTADTP